MSICKLPNLLRARTPIIYIQTYEEDRILKIIKNIVKNELLIKYKREIFTWTENQGLVCYDDGQSAQGTANASKALDFIKDYKKNSVFIMYDFHTNFGNGSHGGQNNAIIRKLKDLIPVLKTGEVRKNIILIAPELTIPVTLQKEITVVDFPLPTLSEIKTKLRKIIEVNKSVIKTDLSEEDEDKLCKAALGLTLQEAENAFALCMVNDGKLEASDIKTILDEKMQIIKKTGILEFIQSDVNMSDVGGLDNLKLWFEKRSNSWSEKAKKYSIQNPSGVLITGVPGCGKSLTAKAASTIWQLPLLRLDFGKIFSGIVGSSEENLRRALKTAEAVAPSILWVDEIEKGLVGLSSNGDSGVSSRIFGTFLTWMQEKTSPVFVVATANNIDNLPPELLRKGRFDEIFFVDLPTTDERTEIFKVHLKKRLEGKDISKEIDFNDNETCLKLAELTEGFVGAEIEQVVVSALYEAFFEDRELLFSDLEKSIKNTVPLSVTRKEQITLLRKWANLRAVAATKKESLEKYKKDTDATNEDDICNARGGRALDI